MTTETFNFCPNSLVPVTLPRDPAASAMTMNGWQFSARPTTPYQKKFKVKLFGLRWFLNGATGLYETTEQPTINARLLETFYERHETWKPFVWVHPHLGTMMCRFSVPLTVPEGMPNSGGLIDTVEIQLIQHNPGY